MTRTASDAREAMPDSISPTASHSRLRRFARSRRRAVSEGLASWPLLLMYGLAAGTLAAGTAHVVGGVGVIVSGRRTYLGALLQVLGVVLIIGLAGVAADPILTAIRRRIRNLFERTF